MQEVRHKVKGPNIALNERTRLRATERHLSYAITQCYLPPDRGERVIFHLFVGKLPVNGFLLNFARQEIC